MLSEVPFLGPVGAVRVGEIDGEFVINPTYEQVSRATLDLVVAGTRDGVTMIESEAKEMSEKRMLEALKFGYESIKKIVAFQEDFAKGIAKEKITPPVAEMKADLIQPISEIAVPAMREISPRNTRVGFNGLLIALGSERHNAQALRLPARKKRRPVSARQHVHFTRNLPDFIQVPSVHTLSILQA